MQQGVPKRITRNYEAINIVPNDDAHRGRNLSSYPDRDTLDDGSNRL